MFKSVGLSAYLSYNERDWLIYSFIYSMKRNRLCLKREIYKVSVVVIREIIIIINFFGLRILSRFLDFENVVSRFRFRFVPGTHFRFRAS